MTHFQPLIFTSRRLTSYFAVSAMVFAIFVGRPPAEAAGQCAASAVEPQADDFAFTTLNPTMVDVLGNDSHRLGKPLQVSVDTLQTPQGGWVELNPDATFTYHREPDYSANSGFLTA